MNTVTTTATAAPLASASPIMLPGAPAGTARPASTHAATAPTHNYTHNYTLGNGIDVNAMTAVVGDAVIRFRDAKQAAPPRGELR